MLPATDAAARHAPDSVERLTIGPAALAAPVAPWDLADPRAADRAGVAVVAGDLAGWLAAAAAGPGVAAGHLAGSPLVTVGVVRADHVPPAVRPVIAGCDLRVRVGSRTGAGDRLFNLESDPAGLAGVLAGWVDRIRAAPDACLLAAQLLRAPRPSLTGESLAYSTLQGGPEHLAWLVGRAGRARDAEPGSRVAVRDGADRVELVLSRPHRRNAFDARMREELCDALDAVAAGPAGRPVVLRGAGRSFCAGGDLDEFGTVAGGVDGHRLRLARSVPRRLRRLSGRLVAGAHGACVGAGVELPAFARVLLATPETTFRLPEAGMGLVPGAGGTVSLPARIGRHRTLQMVVTRQPVDAATARAWGLVDGVVPADALVPELRRAARQLARDGGPA
ncbi:MAG: enoyl-CoA hydratase/isomerase family protein [Micromonosporaceae bacterium]|nr:enoyl-CoA hydratase/isomerase family protein [Micromonosporaceae bacterium]